MFISQQAHGLLKENYKPQLDESLTPAIQELFKVIENKKGVICLDFKYKKWDGCDAVAYYSQFLLTRDGFGFIENLYNELINYVDDSYNLVLMVERSYSVCVESNGVVVYNQPSDVFALVYTSTNFNFNEEIPFDSQYFDKLLNAVNAVSDLSSEMNEVNSFINKLKGN